MSLPRFALDGFDIGVHVGVYVVAVVFVGSFELSRLNHTQLTQHRKLLVIISYDLFPLFEFELDKVFEFDLKTGVYLLLL
jgi:hypothetical protein